MNKIPQIAEAIQTVLTTKADKIAQKTGFTQRQSKLTGSAFVQTLVLSWLSDPAASLDNLTSMAAQLGVPISAQGLDQRFSAHSAACLHQVLDAAVSQIIGGEAVTIPLLKRFSAVYVQDSTTIGLPPDFAHLWPGGGREAAVKLQVRIDYLHGTLFGPFLQAAKRHDRASIVQKMPITQGAIRLADLGYFSLDCLNQINKDGGFYLSRIQVQTHLFTRKGIRLDLPKWLKNQHTDEIDRPILLGQTQRIKTRLIAWRMPEPVAQERRRKLLWQAKRKGQKPSKARLALCDWTLMLTNTSKDLLSLKDAQCLARLRWQIELLFKLWKSHGQVDKSRSQKPWRILTEVYAKIIGMIIQHWVLLTRLWKYPDKSLVKAAQIVRKQAVLIASALSGMSKISIPESLKIIQTCLQYGCRMNTKKKIPNTYQLLIAL